MQDVNNRQKRSRKGREGYVKLNFLPMFSVNLKLLQKIKSTNKAKEKEGRKEWR